MTVIGETPGEQIVDSMTALISDSATWRTNLVVIDGVGISTGDAAGAEYISIDAPDVEIYGVSGYDKLVTAVAVGY